MLAGAVATAGCSGGGSGSPAAPSTPSTSLNLQAEVRDPAGDAVSSALLPVSPDLVSGRLETSGGSLRLSARFAPGIYDQSTTIVTFYLDTDRNPSTGLPGLNDAGDAAANLGVDYMIFVDLTATNSGAIVDPRKDQYPSVCPDGRYVVFCSRRTDDPNIANLWRMDLDGGNPRQLTRGVFDVRPRCSPDSQWVVYEAPSSGTPTVWKVSIDGGEPTRLTDNDSRGPAISPDGSLIACGSREPKSAGRLAIVPFEGGPPRKTFPLPPTASFSKFRWTPKGDAVAYVDTRGGTSNLWSQPLDGSAPKQITHFSSEQIFSFDWSPDGKQLAAARGGIIHDVVLISNFR